MGVTSIRPARGFKPPWLLRIELLDVRPLVWRRLTAMAWSGSHIDPALFDRWAVNRA